MTREFLFFPSNAVANQLVAGVPTAVRAALALKERGDLREGPKLLIAAQDGWIPSDWTKSEFARLLPDVRWEAVEVPVDGSQGETEAIDAVELLCGSYVGSPQKALRSLGANILKATGKSSDGLVSRYLNRPISRSISRVLLKIPGVTPIHATGLAAFTGLLMAAALLFGGAHGLIAGAILFHAASVIDGVDGEIARATMRSSQFGAKLDTITDGITNLAFLCLASLNLYWQGEVEAASYGAIGLGILATGLTALGLRSIAVGGPFTFDAVKNNFRARPSKVTTFLAAITSRDVYAAIFALTFALGFAEGMLIIFACAVGFWLIVVLIVLIKTHQ
ncbi:CDP-alcohol phosphatidyltransferase family protein [Erythrobacter sp. SCSIO 43205]|uniref:CDP-alcohol phosphatidyltransferase family protein n=1 Tax=Erythrobacter sp. SCSIO 43205 TaxID=2779361 RepID=UPI001CA8AF0D|nr:CDP-alcohol phosphatidyltransferase family protein [Erythrobacter sp. SCSIO 43205]UAB77818.1 CDP-alcohol phosphatidyltransferase family protein [Erythrobacter sp. SCSIO 43205]